MFLYLETIKTRYARNFRVIRLYYTRVLYARANPRRVRRSVASPKIREFQRFFNDFSTIFHRFFIDFSRVFSFCPEKVAGKSRESRESRESRAFSKVAKVAKVESCSKVGRKSKVEQLFYSRKVARKSKVGRKSKVESRKSR